jgi:hypothetical protein
MRIITIKKLSHENIEKLLIDVALYVRATTSYGVNSTELDSEMLAIHTSDLRDTQNAMGVYYASEKELDFWKDQSEKGLANEQ